MKIGDLNSRSTDVFKQIVETYLKTGSPVGSRAVSSLQDMALSSASIRNTMVDLEGLGLLYSPHTSAGRMPTEMGLRLFIDGLLEVGSLNTEEQEKIKSQCRTQERSMEDMLTEATTMLSGLSKCASLVLAPKTNSSLKQIEFIGISPEQALVIMVMENGAVENRTISLPAGTPPSTLTKAANYLNAQFGRNRGLEGHTLDAVKDAILNELKNQRAELDTLTKQVVKAGLATWSAGQEDGGTLIVRGRSNLLDDSQTLENMERIRQLFDDLESKEGMIKLLELTKDGAGVKIFIGAENRLFSLSGSSVVISPYADDTGRIVGAIGVIGPTRLNYARVIPMVDFTAKVIGKIL
jgi:heat-inducible transcriptional repressor